MKPVTVKHTTTYRFEWRKGWLFAIDDQTGLAYFRHNPGFWFQEGTTCQVTNGRLLNMLERGADQCHAQDNRLPKALPPTKPSKPGPLRKVRYHRMHSRDRMTQS